MVIREYQEGDELNFLKLDKLIEEHPWNRRNLDNWNWKYKGNNPFGNAKCVYCYSNDQIIGHFALLPLEYFIDGNLINGSNSIAMMVRQDFQNKGLMKYIGDKLFELSDNTIDFTYGIPNDRSYDLHKKFFYYEDWKKLNFYSCLIEKFNFKISDTHKSIILENFDKNYEDFWKTLIKQNYFILNKNMNFMNWRYAYRPDHKYHIFKMTRSDIVKGYYILKIYREKDFLKGHIMEMIFDKSDRETLNEIFIHSINFFKLKKVNEIFFYSSSVNDLEKVHLNKLNISYQRNLIIRRYKNKNSLLSLKIPSENEINFSMGDSLEIF